jgi:predicted Zn finger-like uncharacterized protein
MLIVCPTCGTTYNVGAGSLGDSGRQVRCVRCSAVWVAGKPQPVATAAKSRPGSLPEPDLPRATPRGYGDGRGDADGPPHALQDHGIEGDAVAGAGPEGDLANGVGEAVEREGAIAPREVVTAPPLAPMELDGELVRTTNTARAESAAGDDIESFARRRPRSRAQRQRSYWALGALQTALVTLLVVNAGLIFWRGEVVRAFPQTASFYAAIGLPVNLRGLGFENVRMSRETHDGVTVLVVEGSITNVTSKTVEVPRMRFAVRNATGQEIYTWTAVPARTLISAGEALPFRSRLASPPPEANDVSVRFFSRRDALSGGR